MRFSVLILISIAISIPIPILILSTDVHGASQSQHFVMANWNSKYVSFVLQIRILFG